MPDQEQEFLKKLRQSFAFEAKEQLKIISNSMLKLEREQDEKARKEIVEVMFRQAHNLKGSARAVNMSNIESLCQVLESQLAEMKKGKVPLRANYLDILLLCIDVLERLLKEEDKTDSQLETIINKVKRELVSFFAEGAPGKGEEAQAPVAADSVQSAVIAAAEKSATMDSIRLSAATLDELLLQAEEMLSIKRAAFQHAADISALSDDAALWKREWRNFDTSLRSLKTLVNKQLTEIDILQAGGQINKLISFMEWNHARLNTWLSRLAQQRKLAEADKHTIAVGVDSFLESTKELLMMPCSALLEGFPRLVREMSRDLGKELDLTMRGTQVELDRRILTRMRDPLIHLIRNSIDHGIEPPEVRVKAGKPKKGMLTVAVTQDETGKVEISINDDGAGVDTAKVAAAAIKAGIINASEAHGMSSEDQLDLIFQSAVTTSPIITEISGHGLGLAIVKENVDSLGGRIKLETTPGAGTSIKIFLPVAIATFQGVLLSVAGETVTLPKTNLLRVLRLHESEIRTIEDKDAFAFQDTLRPLVKLADLLELRSGLDATGKEPEQLPFLLVAVVRAGEEVLGLIVDDVLEEQEVMVKKLGKPLSRVRNIAGVTILRTGKAVPVLNVMDLMKSARRLSGRESGPSVQLLAPRPKKRILVVEDTLTSRMLIKNIIEAAGYEVKTATDGVEAFAELTSEPFDLVLADVEMPRMNGLELTKRIRENAKIADLPVVLLTSLASREHREKGVQAGANAYFTKGSFDQTNLLDVIKRLI